MELPVNNIRQRVCSSWHQYLPLIFYIGHQIYQGMSSNQFITPSTQNYQCNCFGNYITSSQYFLSKPKIPSFTNKITPSPLTSQQQQSSSNKNSGKRSLKKNNTSQRHLPPNMSSRVKDQYYQTNQQPLQGQREGKLLRQEQKQRSTGKMRQEGKYLTKTSQCNIRNNNQIISSLHTYYSPPPFKTPTSPTRVIFTHSSPSPIRINFRTSSPQHYSQNPTCPVENPPLLQTTNKNQPKVEVSFNKLNKQFTQNVAQQEIIDFQLTEDNLDSPRMMPVLHKRQKNSKFGQYFNSGQTFKSNIQSKHTTSKQEYKSIIQKKIRNTKNQYQIGNFPQFKKEKGCLKKINDVQETHSLPNSDDDIEDDKESVVLGRLHQYGSTINVSNSFSPTVGSKLVSMKTQSSIGKSYLKSFEFNTDKRQ